MIPMFILGYSLLGLWSAERFRESNPDMGVGLYLSVIVMWWAFWLMEVIKADIPEPKPEEKDEDDDTG